MAINEKTKCFCCLLGLFVPCKKFEKALQYTEFYDPFKGADEPCFHTHFHGPLDIYKSSQIHLWGNKSD